MGRSRLICGDALDRAVIKALMNGDKAQMAFTDPPYNVPIDGHVSGRGTIKHREFAMASGEMTPAQFEEFLRVAFSPYGRSQRRRFDSLCLYGLAAHGRSGLGRKGRLLRA